MNEIAGKGNAMTIAKEFFLSEELQTLKERAIEVQGVAEGLSDKLFGLDYKTDSTEKEVCPNCVKEDILFIKRKLDSAFETLMEINRKI